MKKFLLSAGVALAFVFYVVFERSSVSGEGQVNVIPPTALQVDQNQTPLQTITPAPTPKPAPTPTPVPVPIPIPKPVGQYKDGSYDGIVADAYYGYLQVRVIISNGRISDVQFLQYPSDRSTSRMINGQAMPYFKAEAIQAQNANVDIVSGATASSGAFQQSLASALALAKN